MGFKKFFTKSITCPDVAGESDERLFDLWKDRVHGWYLEPLGSWPATGHEAFIALLCIKEVFNQTGSVVDGPGPFSESKVAEWVASFDGFEPESAEAFSWALSGLGSGQLAMSDCGISGTGRSVVVTDDGVVVFDPWVILGQVRDWFIVLDASQVDIKAAAEVIRSEILKEE